LRHKPDINLRSLHDKTTGTVSAAEDTVESATIVTAPRKKYDNITDSAFGLSKPNRTEIELGGFLHSVANV